MIRRLTRFRLSTLIALVSVAGAFFGYTARELRFFARQDVARERLEALGLGPTKENPAHMYVRVATRKPYDGWLELVASNPKFYEVELIDVFFVSGPCPPELRALDKFRGLRRCTVTGDLNDEILDGLSQCRQLEQLDLRETRVTDEGVARLVALPRLRFLRLTRTRATWRCLEKLAALPALEFVELSEPPAGDYLPPDLLSRLPFRVEFKKPAFGPVAQATL